MLQAIVTWSLHNRAAVLVLAVLLLGTGIYATGQARLDVFPEFAPPQVVVQTEAPGLAALQVEQLITQPIENAVHGMPRLATLRSQSIQGLSVVTAVFQDGTDIYRARQQMNERLGELAGQLPPEVRKPPRMAPLTSSTGRLVTVGFTSDKLSALELRDRVQWTIRPRLLAVAGVAQVTLFGGEVRQFQVQLDPDALAARNLTVGDVVDATRQASGISGTGFQESARQRTVLRVEGQVASAAELARTVVATSEGTPVTLGDIARVVDGPEPKFGDAALRDERSPAPGNGPLLQPSVLLVVYKQLDDDTRTVTQRVETELASLEPVLQRQSIAYHPGLFRQATFIDHAVGNVTESLALGAILVSIVLFVFLFNIRTAVISLTAIPLSLLAAVLVLWAWGIGLNTLTLGGLAIAVGEVVDDAIIDVENIYRRLRENARLGRPRSAIAVVLAASLEVRTAVVYATFIVALVFVPVFFLSGLQGRLFAPLGYAYVLAVMASLAVALTVTPALSLLLLSGARHERPADDTHVPWLLRQLQVSYVRLLRVLDRNTALVVTVTLVLMVAAVWAVRDTGGEFLPELRENHFVVHMRGLPGASLADSMRGGERAARLVQNDPALHDQVRSLAQAAGRAELGEDTTGVETSEIEVDLYSSAARDARAVQKQLTNLFGSSCAGFSFEVLPFLKERINETLSGTGAQVAVKLYGDNLEAIDKAADLVARELGAIKGRDGQPAAVNVLVEPQTGSPELVIRPRWDDAARLGLRNVHLLDALHTAFQGAEINPVYDRNRVIDVTVVLAPEARNDPEAVGKLWLAVPAPRIGQESPGRVRLKQVADVFLSDGRFLVSHEAGLRRQAVTCNVGTNVDVESFVNRAEERIKNLTLPSGVSYTFSGEREAQRATQRELLLLSLAVGAGIVLLLWTVLRSVRLLLLVLVNLPFALVGGVAALYLSGMNVNVGSLVGFVTLFGITTRNGIMMVSHWQHLHEVEAMAWGPELVFRGARERLAPVLMTALVTALGLLPIALGSGEAGREIEGPMAQVILGGLATSTALNLLVLPVLYRRVGGTVEMASAAG